VHHPERVIAGREMKARQGTPGAAHRVEGASLQSPQLRRPGEGLARDPARTLEGAGAEVLQRQAAERKRDAGAGLRQGHIGELEAAAAEVAHHPVRPEEPGHDAEGRQLRLAQARQQFDRVAARLRRGLQEGLAVGGVAGGGGGKDRHLADMHGVAKHAEAGQSLEGALDGFVVQASGGRHVPPEPAHDLLVVERHRGARQAFIGDEAHRVRADIDDGYRPSDPQAAGRGVEPRLMPGVVQRVSRGIWGSTS
jgi:hypothetical protein